METGGYINILYMYYNVLINLLINSQILLNKNTIKYMHKKK